MKRKLISAALALTMVISLRSVPVQAEILEPNVISETPLEEPLFVEEDFTEESAKDEQNPEKIWEFNAQEEEIPLSDFMADSVADDKEVSLDLTGMTEEDSLKNDELIISEDASENENIKANIRNMDKELHEGRGNEVYTKTEESESQTELRDREKNDSNADMITSEDGVEKDARQEIMDEVIYEEFEMVKESVIPQKLYSAGQTSTNWAWPTYNHSLKNDWPRYSDGVYHSGTDFSVPLNTPVYSTCDGEVVSVRALTYSYGKHIKIKAKVNGSVVYMRYCHLNSFAVSAGDKVRAGQLIGYSGSTGKSSGPHLHYEVRNDKDYYGDEGSPTLNPRNYLPGTSYSYEVLSPIFTPVDIGTDFNALIINTETWNKVTINGTNAEMQDETGFRNQLWHFSRQSDGSYEIMSSLPGDYCLDVYGAGGSASNVGIYEDNDSGAQRWFITGTSGAYHLIPACATNCSLDVSGGSHDLGANVQIWETNDSDAQEFSIWKIDDYDPRKPVISSDKRACAAGSSFTVQWDECAYATKFTVDIWCMGNQVKCFQTRDTQFTFTPSDGGVYDIFVYAQNTNKTSEAATYAVFVGEDWGTDFQAVILRYDIWIPICSVEGDNVELWKEKNSAGEWWRFDLQEDGTYKIVNLATNKALDVYGGTDKECSNVGVYKENDSNAQKWFLVPRMNGGYFLIPKCATGKPMTVAGDGKSDGSNIEVRTYASGNDAQVFGVWKMEDDTFGSQPIRNLGDEFYAGIINTEAWAGLTIKDAKDTNVIFTKMDNTRTRWHFQRNLNGSYRITSCMNGKTLEVADSSNKAGANIQVGDYTGEKNQQWYIYGKWNSNYFLKSRCGECVLDLDGGVYYDGVNAQMWNYGEDNTAQKYKIWIYDLKGNILDGKVTLSVENCKYNGKNQEPDVTVELDGKVLERDKDYTLSYKDNIEIGTASVTVTGKDSYTGIVTRNFEIVPVCPGGHTWDNGTTVKAATCTGKGTMEYCCTVCGEKKTEDIPAAGHKTVLINVVEASVEKDGYTGDTYCTVCKTIIETGKVIPAIESEQKPVIPVEGKAIFTVGKTKGSAGETVIVPVTVSNNPGISAFVLQICQDEGLVLEKVESTGLFEGSFTVNTSLGYVSYSASQNTSKDGELLLLTYRIPEQTKPGTYKLDVIYADDDAGNISNEDWTEVPSGFVSGHIEVTETNLGDLNQDGKINAQDATILMRGLAHLISLTDSQKAAADLNGDGKVNAQDATILNRYLAHLITEFSA